VVGFRDHLSDDACGYTPHRELSVDPRRDDESGEEPSL